VSWPSVEWIVWALCSGFVVLKAADYLKGGRLNVGARGLVGFYFFLACLYFAANPASIAALHLEQALDLDPESILESRGERLFALTMVPGAAAGIVLTAFFIVIRFFKVLTSPFRK